MMTSRERILTVLNGGIPDRVPVAPFIQQEFMADYFKRSDTDRLIDASICADELGFDLITKQNINTKPYFLKKNFPNWEINEKNVIEGDNYFKITTITTPKKTFKQVEGVPYKVDILEGIHYVTREFMINNAEEFEIFMEYVPKQDDDHKAGIIKNGKFAHKYIEQRGINAPWSCGGVFNLAATFIDTQNMLMDAICDPEYYHAYMSFFSDVLAKDAACFAESEYDVVGMQGNMANGSMMGENHFREYILPYEKKAYDVLKQANKPVLYHNCGNATNLFPCYKDMGISIYETLAPPPIADTDMKMAKKFFSDTDIVLCGTFDQVEFLKKGTPDAIYKRAAEIMEVGKPNGKYIFAASDYIEQNTPLENFKAMLAGALSAAKY